MFDGLSRIRNHVRLVLAGPQIARSLHNLIEALHVLDQLVMIAASDLVAADQVSVGAHQLNVMTLHSFADNRRFIISNYLLT